MNKKIIFSLAFFSLVTITQLVSASTDAVLVQNKEKSQTDEKMRVEVLSWSPRIFLIHNFLSNEECDYLIKTGGPELKRSTVVDEDHKGEGIVHEARTSEGMFFGQNSKDPTIHGIEKRISLLTLTPIENGEAIQMLRYGKGGQYLPHYDYFDASTPGGAACCTNGGQRAASLIMYLNNVPKGGETIFPMVNISVTPKKGNAVLFYDCQLNGKVDPMTLHGGAPVLEGDKWIATKWIRFANFK